jgi:hypothetical protein
MNTLAMEVPLEDTKRNGGTPGRPGLARRLLSLAVAVMAVWSFVFVIGPRLVHVVPEFQALATFVNESGIETGEFYYTDVEIVGHADHNARSSMEYMPHGPGPE